MEKFYIQNYCSALDNIDIFPLSNSSNNIWNIFDDYDYDEYCFETCLRSVFKGQTRVSEVGGQT